MDNDESIDSVLKTRDAPELIIGLVGPIGADLKHVGEIIERKLETVGYKSYQLRVTNFLADLELNLKLIQHPLEARYRSYITAGNTLRKKLGRNDAFALLSIAAIRRNRLHITGARDKAGQNIAFILSQFKRPEEIDTLRRVYGSNFIQISAYSDRTSRVDFLSEKIAASHFGERRDEFYRAEAESLVNMDEEQEDVPFGQRLRDTFHIADFVVDLNSRDRAERATDRIIRAFFGDHFIAPTIDEHFSYIAKAVSLRSADLSRQVGAVIVSQTGEIVSVGCNEVPRAGGGAYWEGDEYDFRDFKLGFDPNVNFRRRILGDLFRRLGPSWLSDEAKSKPIEEVVDELLHKGDQPLLKEALLADLLEYGRVVHAEMAAISDAARNGLSIKNSTLYCTTFPCHNCARHIVAAGVARVVYIEPYAKSLAEDLYPDSIAVDGRKHKLSADVLFEPFVGVAPARFQDVFLRGKRKSGRGTALVWNPRSAKPILREILPSYLTLEAAVVQALGREMERIGLAAVKPT